MAELCFLIEELPRGREFVRENLARGAWRLDFNLATERERAFALMDTYADQPMSLADACLVRMTELRSNATVFTLDGHFRIYRRNRRQTIPLTIPADM